MGVAVSVLGLHALQLPAVRTACLAATPTTPAPTPVPTTATPTAAPTGSIGTVDVGVLSASCVGSPLNPIAAAQPNAHTRMHTHRHTRTHTRA